MNENKLTNSMKATVAVTFSIMIAINALANILPINGQGDRTGLGIPIRIFSPRQESLLPSGG